MRFHQFQNVRGGIVAIDLDAVWGVCPLGGDETTIYAGGGCFPVKGAVEDVLALISPPAAPDTFEEGLARMPESTGISERLARLDELERFRVLIRSGCSWGYLDHHITRRRTEIEQGA